MNWQPVKGYEGKYVVSDCGQVRTVGGAPVGQWKSDQGYMVVRLSKPRAQRRVHRLVADAFCHKPEGCDVVNHKNHIRDDNRSQNLEWCTQKHNLQHAEDSGRLTRCYWKGRRSPNAILTDEQAASIRAAYASGEGSMAELARKAGISRRSAQKIIQGVSYV